MLDRIAAKNNVYSPLYRVLVSQLLKKANETKPLYVGLTEEIVSLVSKLMVARKENILRRLSFDFNKEYLML